METKRCKFCEKDKILSDFSPHKKSKMGVSSKCKKCASLEQINRYNTNPGFYKNNSKIYRKNNPEKYKGIDKKYKDANPQRRLLDGCRYRAKKNGVYCDIQMEDIIVPNYCPILNIKLEYSKNRLQDNSPSVDRIIPKLGYIKSNIRVISYKANRIKGHATLQELEMIINYLKHK